MATVIQQLADIQTRFKKNPGYKVINSAIVLKFLNEAQDMIESRVKGIFAQKIYTLSLVEGQQEYDLDSGIFKLILVRYNTNNWVIREGRLLDIKGDYANSTGNPDFYYLFANKIGFYPTPSGDEADAITLYAYKNLSKLVESNPGDGEVITSELPERFHYVLERGTEMLMAEMVEDRDRLQIAASRFDEGIQAMRIDLTTNTANQDTVLLSVDEVEGYPRTSFTQFNVS